MSTGSMKSQVGRLGPYGYYATARATSDRPIPGRQIKLTRVWPISSVLDRWYGWPITDNCSPHLSDQCNGWALTMIQRTKPVRAKLINHASEDQQGAGAFSD